MRVARGFVPKIGVLLPDASMVLLATAVHVPIKLLESCAALLPAGIASETNRIDAAVAASMLGRFISPPQELTAAGGTMPRAARKHVTRLFTPGIPEGYGAVEARRAGPAVDAVGDEVAVPLELEAFFGLRLTQRGLELRGDDLLRIGIEVFDAFGLRPLEEPVIEPHLGLESMRGAHPVNVPLDLVSVGAGRA